MSRVIKLAEIVNGRVELAKAIDSGETEEEAERNVEALSDRFDYIKVAKRI